MKKGGNVALLALVCVGTWGCSDWLKGEVRWSDGFCGEKIVGFVNDTFAIVSDFREWSQDLGQFVSDHGELSGIGRQRLCVYNYRVQENGPRWCDTLNNRLDNGSGENYVRGQMTDSIIWGGDVLKSVKLWKIGEKPHEIKLEKSYEGCSQAFNIDRMRQWLDGSFIALGNRLAAGADSCQYAILDTNAGSLTFKRWDEKLKWIGDCDDFRAWGENMVCLKRRGNELLNILVNNEEKDSIYVRDVPSWNSMTVSTTFLSFYGNLFYWAYINSIDPDKWKIKLTPNVRPLSFPSFGEFVDEKKKLVSY